MSRSRCRPSSSSNPNPNSNADPNPRRRAPSSHRQPLACATNPADDSSASGTTWLTMAVRSILAWPRRCQKDTRAGILPPLPSPRVPYAPSARLLPPDPLKPILSAPQSAGGTKTDPQVGLRCHSSWVPPRPRRATGGSWTSHVNRRRVPLRSGCASGVCSVTSAQSILCGTQTRNQG